MIILITGTNGQLGRELVMQGRNTGYEIISADIPEFDITERNSIAKIFVTLKPDLVINAAAYTNVEKAETEPQAAFAVNRNGCTNIAEYCSKADIPLIHISTDYVFDGKKKAPYIETDAPVPLNIYGKSKAEGEQEVRKILEKHIIIRTSWLYGVYGNNFVKTMLRLGKEKKKLQIVADESGSPTNAANLAETILLISQLTCNNKEISWGTYHYCDKRVTNWYNFAQTIFKTTELYGYSAVPIIEPISSAQYGAKAKRPLFSALNCTKIEKSFNIKRYDWEKSLQTAVRRILTESEKQ